MPRDEFKTNIDCTNKMRCNLCSLINTNQNNVCCFYFYDKMDGYVDQHLNRKKVCCIAEKFKFPAHDKEISDYKDTRSNAKIFCDIIGIINSKISPAMASKWAELAKYDIRNPCYYRSGLSYGVEQMRALAKKYKVNEDDISDKNILDSMPEILKKEPHAKSCPSAGQIFKPSDKCSYHSNSTLSQPVTTLDSVLHGTPSKVDKVQTISEGQGKEQESCRQDSIGQESQQEPCCQDTSWQSMLGKLFTNVKHQEDADLKIFKDTKYTYNTLVTIQNSGLLPKSKLATLNKIKKMLICGKIPKKSLRKFLFNSCKHIYFCQNKNDDEKEKIIYLSSMVNHKLPFLVGLLHNKELTMPLKQSYLADSGSDCNILSFSAFKDAGFCENKLIPCKNYRLKGSTGSILNCFLGKLNVKISLFDTNNKSHTIKTMFYVASPSTGLDICILGQPFLNEYSCSLLYEQTNMIKVSCMLPNMNKEIKKYTIKTLNMSEKNSAFLTNLEPISQGSSQVQLVLKNNSLENLAICKIISPNFNVPNINFENASSIKYKRSYYVQEMYDPIELSVKYSNESGQVIPANTLQVPILNICNKNVHSNKWSTQCLCKEKLVDYTELSSNLECRPQPKAENEIKNNSNVKHSLMSSSNVEQRPNLTEDNHDLEEDLIIKMAKEVLNEKDISDKEIDVEKEMSSFLTELDPAETGDDIDKVLERQIANRISIDSDITENTKDDFKVLNSLEKEDKAKVLEILHKYESFWATSPYQIGNFVGYKVRLDVKPGHRAYQKERKQNLLQIEGVRSTLDELEKNGVFEPSGAGHEDFLANLNIVPKVTDSSQIRFLTKADKFVKKHTQNNISNDATAWRATFDFSTLNDCLMEVGKLSLPTISEVQQKVRSCFCSSIDLKNQYFSIRLTNESKSYTNFYHKGTVYCHKVLPMGLSVSPFLAQSAMRWTFSTAVFKKFLQERGIDENKFPFKDFTYVLYYLDDVILFNKRNQCCSELNLSAKELHLVLLDSVIFALDQAGWIASKNKLSILSDEIVFLGQKINTKSNKVGMQDIRVKSILDWRSPRSAAEASSRLAVIGYYSRFAPFLKLLALPIYCAINDKKGFKWGQLEEESFRNVLFVIQMQIQLSHFNPTAILLITSDASAVALNGSFFNFYPSTGQLELIDSCTKIFANAQLRYTPVQKEATALMHTLAYGEAYIRSNTNKCWIFSDASSLQFIQRNKLFNSKQFNDSLYISTLPRLHFFYVSGKSLLLSDILTRQFQNCFAGDFQISKDMASLIPPLKKLKINHLSDLNECQLRDFILSYPSAEKIDVWQKRYFYSQDLTKNQLQSANQNISNEGQLLISLGLGWNDPAVLKLPIWQDIIASKKLNESQAAAILKQAGMSKLHQSVQDLDMDPDMLKNILEKYNTTPNKDKSCYLNMNDNYIFCACEECKVICKSLVASKSLFQEVINNSEKINNFIKSCLSIGLEQWKEQEIIFNNELSKLKCTKAKSCITLLFFQYLLQQVSSNNFVFNKDNCVTFVPFCITDTFQLHVNNNEISVVSETELSIPPLDVTHIKLNLMIGLNSQLGQLKYDTENLLMLEYPHYGSFIKEIPSVAFFNLNNKPYVFKKGSPIITLNVDDSSSLFLLKSSSAILKNNQLNLHNSAMNNALVNLSTAINGLSSYHISVTKDFLALSYKDKLNLINNKKNQANISQDYCAKNKWDKFSLATHAQQLDRIILSQKLILNQNIFQPQMIRDLQLDCEFCSNIIELLESNMAPQQIKNKFEIINKMLYNITFIYEKKVYRLVLPNHICQAVLESMHRDNQMHYNSAQICKLFSLNFYNTSTMDIAKKVYRACTACQLLKRNYKRRFVGSRRTEADNLTPGAHLVCDVAYMPRDKHGFKFCIMFVCRLTGYLVSFPMKTLTSQSCADSLHKYLCAFPAPQSIACDGDGSFSAVFSKLCNDNNIFLRTNIPRSSNTVGAAECSIRDFRTIAIRIAHQTTKGRACWSGLLPLILNSFNSRPPYNLPLDRKHLFLSPFFNSEIGFLFNHPTASNVLNGDGVDLVKSCHVEINKKRQEALKNLNAKMGKPSGYKLQPGQILTESLSKQDRQIIDGSAGLSPGPQNLFKVLEVMSGGQAAHCINLRTGVKMTHSVNNLQPLDINNLLELYIHPNYSFQDIWDQSRCKNLYGKAKPADTQNVSSESSHESPQDDKQIEQNVSSESSHEGPQDDEQTEQKRVTRAGTSFTSSILKPWAKYDEDLERISQAQLKAIQRAIKITKVVGLPLTANQVKAKQYKQQFNLKATTVKNNPKLKTAQKVHFHESVKCSNGTSLNLIDKKTTIAKTYCIRHFILNPLSESLTETCLIKNKLELPS